MNPPPKTTRLGLGAAAISETRPRAATVLPPLTFDDPEEDTNPGTHTVVVAQQLLIVFDALNDGERVQLMALANAFLELPKAERSMLVGIAERMAGL